MIKELSLLPVADQKVRCHYLFEQCGYADKQQKQKTSRGNTWKESDVFALLDLMKEEPISFDFGKHFDLLDDSK